MACRQGTYGFRLRYCKRTEAIMRFKIEGEGKTVMRVARWCDLVAAARETTKFHLRATESWQKLMPSLGHVAAKRALEVEDLKHAIPQLEKCILFQLRQRCLCISLRSSHNPACVAFIGEINLPLTRGSGGLRW